MNADRVEHRGIVAYQEMYGGVVLLYRGEKRVAKIRIDKRKTADELKGIIDEYLKEA